MRLLILFLGMLIMTCLAAENFLAARHRRYFEHIVHVNGIRGKSSVTRLIAAGLQGGGVRVFCKTTGTLPMTIGVDGQEELIRRRGGANIKEQLSVMAKAAKQKAQVLVVECMAVDPELQAVSQQKILKADIGVLTNVRLDHTAEMGATLKEICASLCNTMPTGGKLFTAEADFYPEIKAAAQRKNTQAYLVTATEDLLASEFPDNVALALAVCQALGVEREQALAGMAAVRRDPYASSVHRLPQGAFFLDGMSANDPSSTELVLGRFLDKTAFSGKLILLLNNRPDRGYRTQMMIALAQKLHPNEIWLMGASQLPVERALRRTFDGPLRKFRTVDELPLDKLPEDYLLYAVGNIANEGIKLIERVKKEGRNDVW